MLSMVSQELQRLIAASGFRVRRRRVIKRVPYFDRAHDMLASSADSWHDCIFFVAQKSDNNR